MSTRCYALVRGSALRITALDKRGAVLNPVAYATSKSVVSVRVDEVTESGSNESISTPEEERRLLLVTPTQLVRYSVSIEFLRVDPGVFSLASGVRQVTEVSGNLGFGIGAFGSMPFGDASTGSDAPPQTRGFDVNTRDEPVSFALEIWSKLAGRRCDETGLPEWGYTLFPHIRGGVMGGMTFANGGVRFNITKARSRRLSRWGVGPYDLSGDFERLLTPVSRNGAYRQFITTAAPPEQMNGIQTFADVISNGTPANPMPYPDAPLVLSGGTPATAGPYTISGGLP